MSQLSEKDIHEIVTRVVRATLGVEPSPDAVIPLTFSPAGNPIPTPKN